MCSPIPGTRTTGNGKGAFAIVGPGWTGDTARAVCRILKSPTNTVWVIGRTQTNGKDVTTRRSTQSRTSTSWCRLSAWGENYAPPRVCRSRRDVDLDLAGRSRWPQMDAAIVLRPARTA